MPKKVTPLTQRALEKLANEAKEAKLRLPCKRSDGAGLYVFFSKSAGISWRFDYMLAGKQRTLTIGPWPAVSISAARKRREAAEALLADGVDPCAAKKERKLAANVAAQTVKEAPTFAAVAREWIAANRESWSAQYARVVKSRVETDLIKHFGHKRMADVTPADVRAALAAVEERGVREGAHRLKNYASMIYRYQQGEDKNLVDPTKLIPVNEVKNGKVVLVKGALLPRAKVKHFAKLTGVDLGRFMLALESYPGERATALAIKLTAYTGVRTNETIGAKWSEFENLKKPGAALWRLPPERMKADREHLVPLSTQALAVLTELRELTKGDGYLFPAEPGRRGDHLSNNAMIFGAYRMGLKGKMTIHGLRGSLSTAAYESSLWFPDVIEMQLAHVVGDDTSRAYNAAEHLPKRRELLQWWADHLVWRDKQDENGATIRMRKSGRTVDDCRVPAAVARG